MPVIIEVGSNYGHDTQNFVNNPDNIVYGFEPTPELHLHLKNRFKNNENYYPVPMAVDLEEGFRWFNIAGAAAGVGDWGCSSLLNFNPNIHNEWENRPDFTVTDRCRVMTTRLDTFMNSHGIGEVDYLWVDAQGNDFRVLQSLGDRITSIKAGKCEAAYTVNLYTGTDNSTTSIIEWMEKHGFYCSIIPDSAGKEADVHFVRK